jgi:2-dehydro-3-deoxyphosphooctonate aldolase (KDO 8-P synthase)
MNDRYNWVRAVADNSAPLFFILGPCAMENEQHTLGMAEQLAALAQRLNIKIIFKASFDKANRTSLGNYRSVGMDAGLKILARVREQFGMPIVTDIHESWQAKPVGEVVDVVQIPAFLCRQTDLLIAAGQTGKVVHVKKGQFFRPEKMGGVVEKVASTGNKHIWLCERGTSFGYTDLIVDMKSFTQMATFGCPVVFDVTHAVQKPGELGPTTGGDRRFVGALATAAVTQRIAGIFMETHEEPEKALSDGPNSVRFSQLHDLIAYLMELDAFVKAHKLVELF